MNILFAGLLASSIVFAGELTLHVLPPKKPLDASSPRSVLLSLLKNRLAMNNSPFGKVVVEYQCGTSHEFLSEDESAADYLSQFFLKGAGLSVLAASYEGKLTTGKEAEEEIKKENVRSMKYLLNDAQCARIVKYAQEYREKNVGKNFGLRNRPLYGEGGTSAALAVSFLEVNDLLDHDLRDAWKTTLNLPSALSGPPLRDETVNFLTVLLQGEKWPTLAEGPYMISFYDPEKIYLWAKDRKPQELSYKPAPGGPLWKQHADPAYRKNP